MLGLNIDNLSISVSTNGGEFECSIPFYDGLNIIRAENSSGKSTCVNAIAYGLGLEAILGPSRKRPFPKSLYEEIFDTKKDQNPFFVSRSMVTLDLRNSNNKVARLTRDIAGSDNKISVEIDGKLTDYFLGSAGKVGSAVSERGFHRWLADYIGWALPSVVTFDGAEATLYLECIFPLFFVEQKRGWSEIQANIPTHYGIKNVKRIASEFCLGIDSFEFEKKALSYKNRIQEAESEWDKLISAAQIAAEFNSVDLPTIPEIDKYLGDSNIEFYYLEGDAKISVSDKERSIAKLLERLDSDATAATPDNEKLDLQNAIMRKLQREREELSELSETTMMSVTQTESKLSTLNNDLNQYQQLRRLKKVGSDIDADLEMKICPICESDLYDTLGSRNVKRQPMTLEENIDFLKSQIDFFDTVRNRGLKQLDTYNKKAKLLQSRYDTEARKLRDIREDINDTNGATKALLREKIMAQAALKDAEKLKTIQNELRGRAAKAHLKWTTNTDGLKLHRKHSNVDNKGLVLNKLQSIIRGNLEAFQFNPSAINSISISPHSLRPEQEGYDIVAETSASDYIRIIWAYTLALMELAAIEADVKHGGFVVFDEPRQHEASKLSFTNLIDKASDSKGYGGQVIFATSLDEGELLAACKGKDVNLICFNDYILNLVPKDKDCDLAESAEESEQQANGGKD
jgi:hypothetical protein